MLINSHYCVAVLINSLERIAVAVSYQMTTQAQ